MRCNVNLRVRGDDADLSSEALLVARAGNAHQHARSRQQVGTSLMSQLRGESSSKIASQCRASAPQRAQLRCGVRHALRVRLAHI